MLLISHRCKKYINKKKKKNLEDIQQQQQLVVEKGCLPAPRSSFRPKNPGFQQGEEPNHIHDQQLEPLLYTW